MQHEKFSAPTIPTPQELRDQWYKNCIESARWLRSGAEYETTLAQLGNPPLPPEEREKLAQAYEAKAKTYRQSEV